jgi:pilus assembly protein CpaC
MNKRIAEREGKTVSSQKIKSALCLMPILVSIAFGVTWRSTALAATGAAAVTTSAEEPAPRPNPPRSVAKTTAEGPPTATKAAPDEIEMFDGETRVLEEANVGRLAVGNGKVLSAAVLDRTSILLIANDPGASWLHIWRGKGAGKRIKITVLPSNMARITRQLSEFLKNIPNAHVTSIGDRVVVEGDSLSNADLAKIEAVAKAYGPLVLNLTNPIGWEKTIVMDVKVVEFPTNELREIGLKWTATGGTALGAVWQPIRKGDDGPYQINLASGTDNAAPIVPPADLGMSSIPLPSSPNILSIVNMGLNAQLNMMAQTGDATILAEPILSARNGSKAEFLAGGEIPYVISTLSSSDVIFQKYGVQLTITPRVDNNGVIRATIDSAVSNIDSSITTTAGPAISERKISTEFNVKDGQTIVLSGLLSRDTSTEIDKVPLLGDVPVLGTLFRSKRFQNKETELVFFITPHVVDADGTDIAGLMARANEKLRPTPPALPAPPVDMSRTDQFWWRHDQAASNRR